MHSGKKALRPYVHELTFIAIFEECTYTTSRSEDDTMYTTMIWSYTALGLALNHLCILICYHPPIIVYRKRCIDTVYNNFKQWKTNQLIDDA